MICSATGDLSYESKAKKLASLNLQVSTGWAVSLSAFSLVHAEIEFRYCVNSRSLHTVILHHMLEKERAANRRNGMKYSSILTETSLGRIDKGFGRNTLGCFRLVRQIHVCVTVGQQCPRRGFTAAEPPPRVTLEEKLGLAPDQNGPPAGSRCGRGLPA